MGLPFRRHLITQRDAPDSVLTWRYRPGTPSTSERLSRSHSVATGRVSIPIALFSTACLMPLRISESLSPIVESPRYTQDFPASLYPSYSLYRAVYRGLFGTR